MDGIITLLGTTDIVALCAFVLLWLGFEIVVGHTLLQYKSLSGMMAHKRREWMLSLAERENRIADTAIIAGQQQGAIFFGTSSILAIGGCFSAFDATELALQVFRDLTVVDSVSRSVYELKMAGLTLIFVYTFFKFAWAYRLFNYSSILVGSVEQPSVSELEIRRKQALLAARINIIGSRHFTAGLRGIFMALAYIGWFAGPISLIIMTVAVIGVLVRRQFFSNSRRALASSYD